MPAATDASIGWGDEVWISTDETAANLVELDQVVSFEPGAEETERVEKTHLKSPNRRKQYLAGLIDSGEMTIEFNHLPGSATDVAMKAARTAGDERYVRINYAENGTLAWTDDFMAIVLSYSPGSSEAGATRKATATLAVNEVVQSVAYTAPA